MRNSVRFLLAALIGFSFFFIGNDSVKSNLNDSPDSNLGYAEWDRQRLADPATGEIPAGIRSKELIFANTLPVNASRNFTWDLIGPRDLGGRTRAVAYDFRDENIILAGGVTGGIWRSTDGGQSFTKATDPSQIHSVTCLVQDRRAGHEDTWYAGTGEYYAVVSGASFSSQFSGDGIFKSTDNGQTWVQLPSTASGTPQTMYQESDLDFVWKIVVDPLNTTNDVLLAAVYNGIFRSDDGGATWDAVLGLDTSSSVTADYTDIIVTPGGVYYAAFSSDGVSDGVFRSTDGIAWTNINSGFPSTYNRLAMAYNPQNENEVMVVMESPSSGLHGHSLYKYTYVSGNGSGAGGIWENRSSHLPNGSCTGFFDFDFGYFQTQGGYDMHIAWHPGNDSIIFLGGTNLYRSDNQFTQNTYKWIGGYQCNQANLAQYVYPNHHPDQHGLIILNSDSAKAISFSDGGIHKTDDVLADSVIWTSLNNGYVTSQFYTVSIEEGDANNDILLAGAQDNGIWFTNRKHIDSTWKWVYRGDGSYTGIPNGRPYYIMSIQQGKMYKMDMTDDGDTIGGTRIDPTLGPSSYNFINSFIMDPFNADRLYMNGKVRVWRNDSLGIIPNIGDIYNTINTGWTNIAQSQIGPTDGVISVLEISRSMPDRVYYATSRSKAFRLDQASSATPVKTAITGSNWPVYSYISSVAANPFNADELLLTFSNYNIPSIFYSNDAGATWTDVSGNLEEFSDGTGNGPAVYWANIYPDFNQPTFFVGTSVGLYSTTLLNGASTVWQQEGPSTIGRVVINMIKSRPSDGKIVVATHGNGIFSSQLTPSYIGEPELLTGDFSFSTYPNPFSEITTIDLNLSENGKVVIDIYDFQGRKVKSVCDKEMQKGQQRLFWNRDTESGAAVSNGVYLIHCSLNGKQITRKVVVK